MLPVIVAAANDQAGLVPDDLRTHGKATGFEAGGNRRCVKGTMPDIGHIAGEQRPGLPPVGTIVVEHLAFGEVRAIAEPLPPTRIVVHAVRWIGHA
jgi:hypothetical protein